MVPSSSAAAKPVVRHRLTYIKMFVLTYSLRKPTLTSWHFGAGRDNVGQKCFFGRKMRKTRITLQNSRNPPVGRNFAWLISKRVLNKTCDAIINDNYIFNINLVYLFRGRGRMA